MDAKLSDRLESSLSDVEREIKLYLREKSFYLELRRKDYAAGIEGQTLVNLTTLAINLRYEISWLKKIGL
jgi:hypothetical protein